MFDTRNGALPVSASGVPGGLRGGWYPFWAAAVMAAGGVFVVVQHLRSRTEADEGVFKGASGVLDLVRFVAPMIVATFLMSERLLGFYLASGAYTAYYAGITARYRWYWSALGGVLIAVACYGIFELAFSALLPKSFLYYQTDGAFPF